MEKGKVANKYTDRQLADLLKQAMTTGLKDASPLYEAEWIVFLGKDNKRITLDEARDIDPENCPWAASIPGAIKMLDFHADFMLNTTMLSQNVRDRLAGIYFLKKYAVTQDLVDRDFSQRCFELAERKAVVNV